MKPSVLWIFFFFFFVSQHLILPCEKRELTPCEEWQTKTHLSQKRISTFFMWTLKDHWKSAPTKNQSIWGSLRISAALPVRKGETMVGATLRSVLVSRKRLPYFPPDLYWFSVYSHALSLHSLRPSPPPSIHPSISPHPNLASQLIAQATTCTTGQCHAIINNINRLINVHCFVVWC